MTRHHFVPLSIIITFTSAEAWQVVSATPEIRMRILKADQMVIISGQKQNWPICVFEKERRRITRKLAGDVCSMPNLYRVLNYDDQLVRALIRYNLSSEEIPLRNFDDLLQLGVNLLDSDMLEKMQVGKIDADFAGILPILRAGQPISEEQINIIYRFITFARFRTPTWKRVYYPEVYERIQKQNKNLLINNWNENQQRKLSGRSLDAIDSAVDNNLYQMAIVTACGRETTALHRINAKILVLHNTGTTPFVTCDNPARSYFPDRIQRIATETLPGMGNPRCQITYPIDPSTCLLVSCNPALSNFAHENVNEKQVRKINCALALMADREIIFFGPNTAVFENWLELHQLQPIKRP